MNRRDFLKTSSTTLIAVIAAFHAPALLPRLLTGPRRTDAESQWCYWMMDNLSVNEIIYSIKEYGYRKTKGMVTPFFSDFVNSQPETVFFIKTRLSTKDPTKNEDSRIWDMLRRQPRSVGLEWYRNAHEKHVYAMNKFFPTYEVNLYVKSYETRLKYVFGDEYYV